MGLEEGLDVSFIIVNLNTKGLLIDCIGSIMATVRGLSFEIWVVDNGSSDGSVASVRESFPDARIIENGENCGFARANNMALRQMRGAYALLLNTDTLLRDNAVATMIGFLREKPEAAVCGGQLLNEDGSRQNSIANIPNLATELTNKSLLRRLFPSRYPGKEHVFSGPAEVESVVGACMCVRKTAIDDAGLLDEDYFFFFEETDWCLRFRQRGWKVFFHPHAGIVHLQGRSAGRTFLRARIEYWISRYTFFRKHRPLMARVILRTGLFIKLLLDLSLSVVSNAFSFFASAKKRRKLALYAVLLLWHFAGCPASWGLRPRRT